MFLPQQPQVTDLKYAGLTPEGPAIDDNSGRTPEGPNQNQNQYNQQYNQNQYNQENNRNIGEGYQNGRTKGKSRVRPPPPTRQGNPNQQQYGGELGRLDSLDDTEELYPKVNEPQTKGYTVGGGLPKPLYEPEIPSDTDPVNIYGQMINANNNNNFNNSSKNKKRNIPPNSLLAHVHVGSMSSNSGAFGVGTPIMSESPPPNPINDENELKNEIESSNNNNDNISPGATFTSVSGMNCYKLAVVGDIGNGKTSLCMTYKTRSFPNKNQLSNTFPSYRMDIPIDTTHVTVEIWDTNGLQAYAKTPPLSYQNCHCIILTYSITSRASLKNVKDKWIAEMNYHCGGVPFVLFGLKWDLRLDTKISDAIKLTTEEGQKVANEIGARAFCEGSALLGRVKTMFDEAVRVAITPEEDDDEKSGCCIML